MIIFPCARVETARLLNRDYEHMSRSRRGRVGHGTAKAGHHRGDMGAQESTGKRCQQYVVSYEVLGTSSIAGLPLILMKEQVGSFCYLVRPKECP